MLHVCSAAVFVKQPTPLNPEPQCLKPNPDLDLWQELVLQLVMPRLVRLACGCPSLGWSAVFMHFDFSD